MNRQIEVLKLTGIITPGASPNVFVGWIKEIDGITVQGKDRTDAFEKLKYATKVMMEHKDHEARKLLSKQLGKSLEALADVTFVSDVALA